MPNYIIKIPDLNNKIEEDGFTLNIIKDVSQAYYLLLRKNISKFSKSGKLLNNWKFELYNYKQSSVYTNVVYARTQDQGNEIRITRKMRNYGFYMYKKTKNKMWLAIAITKKSHIVIPAKNYSQVNTNSISKLIEDKYGR